MLAKLGAGIPQFEMFLQEQCRNGNMGTRAEYEARRQAEIAAFKPLKVVERELIDQAKVLCHGNRKEMMALLGMSKTTLYRRLAEYRKERLEEVSPVRN